MFLLCPIFIKKKERLTFFTNTDTNNLYCEPTRYEKSYTQKLTGC